MPMDQMIITVDEEIARLQIVRRLLAGETIAGKNGVGAHSKAPTAKTGRVKRVLSAEARERIASAQRKRWAAVKKAAKKAAKQ